MNELKFKVNDTVRFKNLNSLFETVNIRTNEAAETLFHSVGKIVRIPKGCSYYFVDFPDPYKVNRKMNLCVYPHCLIKVDSGGNNISSGHKFTKMFLLDNDPHKKNNPPEKNAPDPIPADDGSKLKNSWDVAYGKAVPAWRSIFHSLSKPVYFEEVPVEQAVEISPEIPPEINNLTGKKELKKIPKKNLTIRKKRVE